MADYGFVHEGKVFTPNGTQAIDPAENDARNAAIEQSELAEWRMRPETMIAYFTFPAEDNHGTAFGRSKIYRSTFFPRLCSNPGSIGTKDRAVVKTWKGTELGTIVRARVYRHNFGARMVAIVVRGNNGASYHGRASWGNGSVVRLRRMK